MSSVLVTAPYMIPFMDRFRPVLQHFGVKTIEPDVEEHKPKTC